MACPCSRATFRDTLRQKIFASYTSDEARSAGVSRGVWATPGSLESIDRQPLAVVDGRLALGVALLLP